MQQNRSQTIKMKPVDVSQAHVLTLVYEIMRKTRNLTLLRLSFMRMFFFWEEGQFDP